jgi:hypothetical protein
MEDVIKARESPAMTRENNTGLEDNAETTVLSETDRRASRSEGCNQGSSQAARGHGAKDLILYSTKSCLRCTILRAALMKRNLDWSEKSMDDAEVITNMRLAGCFAREAPVLKVDGEYWLARAIFRYNGELNEAKLKEILNV